MTSAVLCWAIVLLLVPSRPTAGPWTAALLLVAFVIADFTQLHVEIRRQTVSLSLSEYPLVLGLFLVDPLTLVVTRITGGLLVALWRRAAAFKTAFNVSLWFLELGLSVGLFAAVGGGAASGPRAWAAAYTGMIMVSLVTGSLMVLALVRLQGPMARRVVAAWLRPLMVAALLTTSAALLTLLVVRADARAVPVLLLLVLLLIGGYRAYGVLLRRHQSLELMQAFTSTIGVGGHADELLSAALGHARALLSADCAMAVVLGSPTGPGCTLRQQGDEEGPVRPAEQSGLLAALFAGGGAHRVVRGTTEPQEVAWLSATGLRDALLVPLVGPDGVSGALVVGQRLGEMSSFSDSDLTLLEMMASHLEIALRSAELVERLRDEATHDALTGLPNRVLFHERLTAAAARRRDDEVLAVMLLDLDGFKDVNDTLGHESGDEVLVHVAHRLAAAVGPEVTVARLGGDEFALVVPVVSEPDGADVARVLHEALRRPFSVSDVELEVRASLGIALCPQHGEDSSVLLRHADIAMYAAKTKQQVMQVYNSEIDRSNPRRLALVNDLRVAVESGALVCHYQPKVRVADTFVTGVEALARWHHPTLGQVVPDDFIPIAEHTGLIVPLTSLVLRTSIEHCAGWRRNGHAVDLAVNVSPRALLSPDFVGEVAGLLDAHDVPPSSLTLEVTESSVMHDPRRVTAVLNALNDLGVQLSIDDFGTGYSSLAYLQRLPVHEVKIDKSFVLDLATESGDVAIVRSIVDLGHNLGLRVVAEGVEDVRSMAVLRELGCDTAQGYLISRPMPHDRLLSWLSAGASERHLVVVPQQEGGSLGVA